MDPDAIIPIFGMLSVFVFLPLSIGLSRYLWRRADPPARAGAPDDMTLRRLEELQQAVDTIAIEVERISEGQRFVTKMLSDRSLGAGPAEPVRSAAKSAVPNERG